MHADDATNSILTGGMIRLCAMLFVALVLLFAHTGALRSKTPNAYPTTVQFSSHTLISEIGSNLKPRIKKQLRRLVAL